MTEIQAYTQDSKTPTESTGSTLMQKGVQKLRQHAELKAMAFDYADFITKTGACPDPYKNKPMDAAAAIIRGTALGFDPDGALEAFFVINGKTGMYSRAQIAVAENAGCRVWEVESSDDSVTWAGVKPGIDKVQQVTWTIDRAKKAGYTSNKRYNTNPEEMLRSKCQAELARILAPGPLMGLYSETETTAFEPPVKRATATRDDERGMGQVRAALAAKKEQEAQEEQGAPAPSNVERVNAVETREELDDLMGALQTQVQPDEWAELVAAANTKAEEL